MLPWLLGLHYYHLLLLGLSKLGSSQIILSESFSSSSKMASSFPWDVVGDFSLSYYLSTHWSHHLTCFMEHTIALQHLTNGKEMWLASIIQSFILCVQTYTLLVCHQSQKSRNISSKKNREFYFLYRKAILNSADIVHWMHFCDWKFLERWMFCTFYYHCRIREAMKTETPWFWLTEKPLKQHVWSRSTAGSYLAVDIKTILYSHTIFPPLTHCLSDTLTWVSHRTHK